jgi:hypothetical protein
VAHFVSGDALDDALGPWSKRISSHLAADEIAHVTWKEATAFDASSAAYVARAKTALARALQRRIREPKIVEITATFSQNLKDDLFVAEIHRENESFVEMASLPRTTAAPTETAAGFRLDRKMLWEQETQILDLAANIGESSDQMLVLDTVGVNRYERQDAKWQKVDGIALEIPAVRDPRGRLTLMEDTVVAEVPGLTCSGKWMPAVTIECKSGGRFTAGRNTIEETGWPAYFAHAAIAGEDIVVASDGRTYIYDANRTQRNSADLWQDLAVISSTCSGRKILATDLDSHALALFDVVNHSAVRVSDSLQMPGTITATWASGSTGIAVVRNKNTSRYEAYSISVDCGR